MINNQMLIDLQIMDVHTKRNIYNSVMKEISLLTKELLNEKKSDSSDKDEMFAEVVSNYFDEEIDLWTVDAWFPNDEDDEYGDENDGCVIAYIDPETFSVTWLDEDAMRSRLANEVIDEKIEELERNSD